MTPSISYSSQKILDKYRLNEETAYYVMEGLTHNNMRNIADKRGIHRNTVQSYRNKFAEMHEDERLLLFDYLLHERIRQRLGEKS